MIILKIYSNGDEYIIGNMASIEPNGIETVEEYDISHLTKGEIQRLKINGKDKDLLKKARKIK